MESVQIGASSLTDEQLEMTIPNKDIMKDIDGIRENAKNIVTNNTNINDIDRVLRKYNNIISILGGRGTGKTSVLLTIQEKLNSDNYNKEKINLLLPLIKPDCIGNGYKNNDTVIGWLIGGFKKIVEEIENDIYVSKKYKVDNEDKNYFQNCRKREDNRLRSLYNKLIEYYLYTRTDYQDIIKKEYESFNSYVENISYSVDSEQKLIIKFYEFINEVILILKKSENQNEPLIFLFFDDIELSVNRCEEIISVITKYLLHPNIVVLIAGDIEHFKKRLVLELLKKDNLVNLIKESSNAFKYIDDNINPKEILQVSNELAEDVLKKVMPPVFRNNLPRLNLKNRCNFIYNNSDTLGSLLYKVFIDRGMKNLSLSTKRKRLSQGFLNKDNNLKIEGISEAFFYIFDDTPRGLINICYLLSNFLDENKEFDSKILYQFVETLIRSSRKLAKNEKIINDVLEKDEKNSIYKFNYDKLLLRSHSSVDKEVYKEIFIFMIFIENITSILKPREIQGDKIVNQIFNNNGYGFKIYPEIKNSNIIIQMYIEIKNIYNLNYNIYDNYKINDSLLEYFYILKEIAKKNDESLVKFFNTIGNEDTEWVKEKCEMICSQTLEKHHALSNIIFDLKNKCIKMKADNMFLQNLTAKLNDIVNIEYTERHNYERFDEKIQETFNDMLEKRKDISNYKILDKNKRVVRESFYRFIENKIISHLYLFSTNCKMIYHINNSIRSALNNLTENSINGIYPQIAECIKNESLNEYEYNNIINQLNYNITLQPKASVYQDIKNIFVNCPWVYEYQGYYKINGIVDDFVIYILVNYLRYVDNKSDEKGITYYEKFIGLYNEIIGEDDNSFIKEYLQIYRASFRVIV